VAFSFEISFDVTSLRVAVDRRVSVKFAEKRWWPMKPFSQACARHSIIRRCSPN